MSVNFTVHQLEMTAAMDSDDAAWVVTCSILIMTMQSGFALLESGNVSPKNAANIMVKNALDVLFGGLSYFCFGFAFAYGQPYNSVLGFGNFLLLRNEGQDRGSFYVKYLFQFAFVCTTTTIVSGACCERIKLRAYTIFSFIFPAVMGVPTAWIWRSDGWLSNIGFYDFSGACVIHFAGGCAALVANVMLGPRIAAFSKTVQRPAMSSPVTTLTGTFILWWAWMAFSCGSTFGITGDGWKQASLAALNTLNGSFGGSAMGLLLSFLMSKGRHVDIGILIDALLGGLVSVTGCGGVIGTLEALIIGAIGAVLTYASRLLFRRLKLDDPVGVLPVHFVCGLWGTLAVGLFARDMGFANVKLKYTGLLHGGGLKLLAMQLLGCTVISIWSVFWTFIIFSFLKKCCFGIRISVEQEVLGADILQHKIIPINEERKFVRLFLLLQERDGGRVGEEVEEVVNELKVTKLQRRNSVSSVLHFDTRQAGKAANEALPTILEQNVLDGEIEDILNDDGPGPSNHVTAASCSHAELGTIRHATPLSFASEDSLSSIHQLRQTDTPIPQMSYSANSATPSSLPRKNFITRRTLEPLVLQHQIPSYPATVPKL